MIVRRWHLCSPRELQDWPFQKYRKGEVPSVVRPAAKMLLMFPAFTSAAVTGPGRSLPLPTADQVVFENAYDATFAGVLSASMMEPAAINALFYTK